MFVVGVGVVYGYLFDRTRCQLFGPISVDVSKYFYYYADAFLSLHERNVESSLFAGSKYHFLSLLSLSHIQTRISIVL